MQEHVRAHLNSRLALNKQLQGSARMPASFHVRVVSLLLFLSLVISVSTATATPPLPKPQPQEPQPTAKPTPPTSSNPSNKDAETPPPPRATENQMSVMSTGPANIMSTASVPQRFGNSPIDPPQGTDTTFVADNDGDGPLDQYLYQSDVSEGRLTFNIPITRYFSSLIEPEDVDPKTGLLNEKTVQNLVNKQLLPAKATLTLQVYDVDHEDADCAEMDLVLVNGLMPPSPNSDTKLPTLTSGDGQWAHGRLTFPSSISSFLQLRGKLLILIEGRLLQLPLPR